MRFLFLFLLLLCTPPVLAAAAAGDAVRNARQAGQALWQAHRVMHAWMKRADPVTGLLPRTGRDPNWVVRDSAADLYPFLVICSRLTEPGMFDNQMPLILRQEHLLTRRLGRLSDDFAAGGAGFVAAEADIDRIIFGSSEYAKDGLLPLVELLGDTAREQRLVGIAEDLARYAPYDSPRGKLPARTSEVNGDALQVWCRLAWKTGSRDFVDAAFRLADAYLFDMLPATGYLPAKEWDFATGKALRFRLILSDHGNEIVGGLWEALMLASHVHPEKAQSYRKPFLQMIDRLLETGGNEDGLWVTRIDVPSGEVTDRRHAHCWGYLFNAVWVAYLVSGEQRYRQAVGQAIEAVTRKAEYLFDAAGADRNYGANAYSDTIEGALVLLNRLPNRSAELAVEADMQKLLARVRPDGIVEDWYGDGNFVRTALMYVLAKTQGAWLDPWRPTIQLGAARHQEGILLHLSAEAAWQGRLRFDYPRHRRHWRMARKYPRLNEWPEWFTVEFDRMYTAEMEGRSPRRYVGWDLLAGIPLAPKAGQQIRVRIG